MIFHCPFLVVKGLIMSEHKIDADTAIDAPILGA